jgi:hypothetical protein
VQWLLGGGSLIIKSEQIYVLILYIFVFDAKKFLKRQNKQNNILFI